MTDKKPVPRLEKAIEGVKRHRLAFLLSATGLMAVTMRIFYSAVIFNQTLYSGDAFGVLLQSYFISEGRFNPRITNLWGAKSLIAFMYGFFIRILPFDPIVSVRIVTCVFTTAAVLILTYITYRYINKTVALFFGVLLALNPFWSFVSTEPEKAPLVLFFFSLTLLFLFLYRYGEKGRRRNYALLGLSYLLMLLSYSTGAIFAVAVIIIYVVFAWDMRYREKKLRVLTDKFLYVLAGLLLFVNIALPRILEHLVTHQPLYTSITTEAPATTNKIAQYFQYLYNVFAYHKQLAAIPFLEAVRNFTGALVFGLGLLGILVYLFSSPDRRRRINTAPFFIFVVVVTLAFSMQNYCFSHNSRYPYYVIPAFLFFAAYFLGWFTERIQIVGFMKKAILVTVLVLLVIVLQLRLVSPTKYESYRLRYYTHKLLSEDLLKNIKVKPGEGIIVQKWPSILYYLLLDDLDRENNMYLVGWNCVDLNVFTEEFIADNNIKYFIYDKVGDDYYKTPENLLEILANQEELYVVMLAEVSRGKQFVKVFFLD